MVHQIHSRVRSLVALVGALIAAIGMFSSASAQIVSFEAVQYGPNAVMGAVFGSDDGEGALNKKALHVDSGGNSVMVGRVFSGANQDWLIAKFNSAGALLWRANLNGQANGDDWAYAVQRDASGDYFVTGHTEHSGATGAHRCTVAKFNGTTGAEMWRFNPAPPNVPSTTTPYASSQCRALALDSNGDVYATGRVREGTSASGANSGNADAYVVKITNAGAFAWHKVYQGTYAGTVADPRDSNAGLVVAHSNTAIYLAMRLNNAVANDMDWGLIRFDASGTDTMTIQYVGGDAGANDRPRALAVSGDGSRLAVGGFLTFGGFQYGVATVYQTSNMSTLSNPNFGSPNGNSRVSDASFDAANNAYFSGARWREAAPSPQTTPAQVAVYASKFSASGSGSWNSVANVFTPPGRYAEGLAHTVDSAGNLYVAGFIDPTLPVPGDGTNGTAASDLFIVKFQSDGFFAESRTIDGPGVSKRDRAHAIGIDSGNNLYVAGNVTETAANGFRLNFGVTKLSTSAGLPNVWAGGIVRPTAVATSARLGSLDSLLAKKAMKVDSNGNVYTASRVHNGFDSDVLVAKHGPTGTLLWSAQVDRLIGNTATSGNDIPYALALDPSEANVYVVGATQGVNNGEATPYKALVMKYSAAGIQQWISEQLTAPTGNAFAFDVVASADAAYVVGVTNSVSDANGLTATSNGQWLVAKVVGPAPQDVRWRRTYASGNFEDRAFHVAIEAQGASSPQLYNVYAGGRFNSGADNSAANINNWIRVVKFAETAENAVPTQPNWVYTPNSGRDLINDMRFVGGGTPSIFFAGQKADSSVFPPVFNVLVGKLTNLNAASPTAALATFTGDNNVGFADTGQALAIDASGNVYVTGLINNSAGQEGLAVIKTNSALVEQWRTVLNPTTGNNFDTGYAIATTLDGPVVTGMLFDNTLFMGTAQLRASDGEIMWFIDHDTRSRDLGLAVQTVPSGVYAGRIYVAGWGGEPEKNNTLVIQAIDRASCTLKVDGRGSAPRATTDGLIILRRILGIDESAASNGTSPLNTIDERDNLVSTLALRGDYDVDASGTTDFKDGLVILRYLLGFTGNSVTDGLALTGTRNLWEPPSPTVPSFNNSIRIYLQSCGTL
jgi:hypothetical protein